MCVCVWGGGAPGICLLHGHHGVPPSCGRHPLEGASHMSHAPVRSIGPVRVQRIGASLLLGSPPVYYSYFLLASYHHAFGKGGSGAVWKG